MTAFLLAWKETGWPYEDIVRMITILDEQGFVDEPWRIAAHNMAKPGDRVWVFADGAYDRRTLLDKAAFLDFVVEVVRRTDTDPGFKVIPRRWVVERSIGWLTRYRRLVRDYEQRLDVSEAIPRYGKSAPPPDHSSMTFSNGL